jgi:hypothetical protein
MEVVWVQELSIEMSPSDVRSRIERWLGAETMRLRWGREKRCSHVDYAWTGANDPHLQTRVAISALSEPSTAIAAAYHGAHIYYFNL